MIDKRKRIYIGGGAALLLLVGVGVWLLLRPAGIYRAIPQSAVAVIETHSWLKVIDKLNTTYTGTEFKKTALATRLQGNLTLMGNMLGGNSELANALNKGNTLVSLHLASADSFDLLFISNFSGVSDDVLQNHLRSLKEVMVLNVRVFKGQQLFDVKLRSGAQFTISNFKGILSFSATTFLTEASVSALLTGESIASESNFNKVRKKVAKDGDVQLYINYKKAAVIMPVAVRMNMVGLLADVQHYADWGAYSLAFTNQGIQLKGVAINNDDGADNNNVKLKPILSLIPDNAAVVNVSGIDTATLKGGAMADYFKSWIGEVKAFITLEPLQAEFDEQNMLVLQVADYNTAKLQLRKLISLGGGSTIPVDTFLKDEIYYLENGAVLNGVFNHAFTRFGKVWFTVRNNAAFFSNSPDVLMLSLEKVSSGETLAKEARAIKLSESNSAFTYFNPQRGNVLLSALMKEGSSVAGFLKQFLTITVVSARQGSIMETDVVMQAGSARVSKGLLWKTRLKTICTYPPQIVWNGNTHEQEIFVQDTANNIYLLTRSGEILFTRNIGEPIISATQQLDYYSNGDIQYIFNSANQVYVIDRMGNNVGSYPLRLTAVAAAGLTLVTDTLLATNKYFIPGINGAIYGYEGNGKPLSGWSPKTGTGNVVNPVTAFSIGRKTYIAAYNTAGVLHLFDVRGNKLWEAQLSVDTANAPVLVQNAAGLVRFIQIAGGELRVVSNDGNMSTTPLIDSATFSTASASTDSTFNYYFSTGNTVRSYSNTHRFLKSAGLGSAAITGMKQIFINSETYLAVQTSSSVVMLYDSELNKAAEFSSAIAGSYVVTDLFNRNELIVLSNGTGANISCTRLK